MYQVHRGVICPEASVNIDSSAPSSSSAGAAYRSEDTSVRNPARTTRSVSAITARLIRERPKGRLREAR